MPAPTSSRSSAPAGPHRPSRKQRKAKDVHGGSEDGAPDTKGPQRPADPEALQQEITALRHEVQQLRETVEMLYEMVTQSTGHGGEESEEEQRALLDRNPRLRTGM